MLMGQSIATYFDSGMSRTVMFITLIIVIALSAIMATKRKKKLGIESDARVWKK
jgi:hypothetical protein